MNVNALIRFFSRSDSTEALVPSIAERARFAGTAVRLRRTRELVGEEIMRGVTGWLEAATRMNAAYKIPCEDAEWSDASLSGTFIRFGSIAAELKAYMDSLGGLWFGGRLNGKVGFVFTSSSTSHGGNQSTRISMHQPLAHLGLTIALGYADPNLFKAGTPYGASSVSGHTNQPPTLDDLQCGSIFQGRRVYVAAGALQVIAS